MRKSVFSSVADNSASAGPGLHRGNWTEEQQRVLDKTKVFVDDVKRSLVVQASQHHDEHQGPADYGNFPNPRITKQLSNKQRLLETYLSLDLEATLRFFAEVTTSGIDSLQQYRDEVKKRQDHDYSGVRYEDSEQGFQKLDVHLVVLGAHRDSSRGLLAPALMDWRTKMQEQIRVGLLIGPFFLDWNDHSLVIPRKLFSSAASSLATPLAAGSTRLPPFSLNIGTCQIWEVAEKVADIIVDFNCNRVYSDKLNSQTFAYAVLEKLGLHKKIEAALRPYTEENIVSAQKNFSDALNANPNGINWETMSVPDAIQDALRELVLQLAGGLDAEGPICAPGCSADDQTQARPISGAFEAASITVGVDSLLVISEEDQHPHTGDDPSKPKKKTSFKDLLSGGLFGRKQRASTDLTSPPRSKSGSTRSSAQPDADPSSPPLSM